MTDTQTISKFDRIYGGLQDVSLCTKPSTIKIIQSLTGKTETFIVQTMRHPELGDTIFIEIADDSGLTRIVIPPKVSNVVGSQREALTSRGRSISAKRSIKTRMANGWKPDFTPKDDRPRRAKAKRAKPKK